MLAQLSAQAQQQHASGLSTYVVINLGTLGGSASNGFGGANDREWVTGDANLQGDQNEHAFLWRDGVMTDLGTLGGPNSSVGFPVKNNKGVIAGSAQISEIDPLGEFWGQLYTCTALPCEGYQYLNRPFLWQNGVMTELPKLGGNNALVDGVNLRGQIIGISETAIQDPNCFPPQVLDWEAVIWGPRGEIQELPPLPGDSVGAALGLNDNRQVVGFSGACAFPSFALPGHAVLWENGLPTNLGSFGGKLGNFALGVNNRGQIVGGSDLPGDATGHAFLWQNGVMTDLGTLPGDFSSVADDINDKGQVTGASCDVNFNCRAFLWEKGVMIDLNTLLSPDSTLQLISGEGINSEGEITGTEMDPTTGDTRAFLAIPVGGSSAAQPTSSSKPKVPLPEKVRKLLQRRMRFGRL